MSDDKSTITSLPRSNTTNMTSLEQWAKHKKVLGIAAILALCLINFLELQSSLEPSATSSSDNNDEGGGERRSLLTPPPQPQSIDANLDALANTVNELAEMMTADLSDRDSGMSSTSRPQLVDNAAVIVDEHNHPLSDHLISINDNPRRSDASLFWHIPKLGCVLAAASFIFSVKLTVHPLTKCLTLYHISPYTHIPSEEPQLKVSTDAWERPSPSASVLILDSIITSQMSLWYSNRGRMKIGNCQRRYYTSWWNRACWGNGAGYIR